MSLVGKLSTGSTACSSAEKLVIRGTAEGDLWSFRVQLDLGS